MSNAKKDNKKTFLKIAVRHVLWPLTHSSNGNQDYTRVPGNFFLLPAMVEKQKSS